MHIGQAGIQMGKSLFIIFMQIFRPFLCHVASVISAVLTILNYLLGL